MITWPLSYCHCCHSQNYLSVLMWDRQRACIPPIELSVLYWHYAKLQRCSIGAAVVASSFPISHKRCSCLYSVCAIGRGVGKRVSTNVALGQSCNKTRACLLEWSETWLRYQQMGFSIPGFSKISHFQSRTKHASTNQWLCSFALAFNKSWLKWWWKPSPPFWPCTACKVLLISSIERVQLHSTLRECQSMQRQSDDHRNPWLSESVNPTATAKSLSLASMVSHQGEEWQDVGSRSVAVH